MPSPKGHKYLANIKFRIDSNEVYHSRTVFGFKDFLGAVSGIEFFLLRWLTVIFGGFINYNASIEVLNQHYSSGKDDKEENLE